MFTLKTHGKYFAALVYLLVTLILSWSGSAPADSGKIKKLTDADIPIIEGKKFRLFNIYTKMSPAQIDGTIMACRGVKEPIRENFDFLLSMEIAAGVMQPSMVDFWKENYDKLYGMTLKKYQSYPAGCTDQAVKLAYVRYQSFADRMENFKPIKGWASRPEVAKILACSIEGVKVGMLPTEAVTILKSGGYNVHPASQSYGGGSRLADNVRQNVSFHIYNGRIRNVNQSIHLSNMTDVAVEAHSSKTLKALKQCLGEPNKPCSNSRCQWYDKSSQDYLISYSFNTMKHSSGWGKIEKTMQLHGSKHFWPGQLADSTETTVDATPSISTVGSSQPVSQPIYEFVPGIKPPTPKPHYSQLAAFARYAGEYHGWAATCNDSAAKTIKQDFLKRLEALTDIQNKNNMAAFDSYSERGKSLAEKYLAHSNDPSCKEAYALSAKKRYYDNMLKKWAKMAADAEAYAAAQAKITKEKADKEKAEEEAKQKQAHEMAQRLTIIDLKPGISAIKAEELIRQHMKFSTVAELEVPVDLFRRQYGATSDLLVPYYHKEVYYIRHDGLEKFVLALSPDEKTVSAIHREIKLPENTDQASLQQSLIDKYSEPSRKQITSRDFYLTWAVNSSYQCGAQKQGLPSGTMAFSSREGPELAVKDISRLKLFGFYNNSGWQKLSDNMQRWIKSDCGAYLFASFRANAYREDGFWLKLTLTNQAAYLKLHEQAVLATEEANPKQAVELKL